MLYFATGNTWMFRTIQIDSWRENFMIYLGCESEPEKLSAFEWD